MQSGDLLGAFQKAGCIIALARSVYLPESELQDDPRFGLRLRIPRRVLEFFSSQLASFPSGLGQRFSFAIEVFSQGVAIEAWKLSWVPAEAERPPAPPHGGGRHHPHSTSAPSLASVPGAAAGGGSWLPAMACFFRSLFAGVRLMPAYAVALANKKRPKEFDLICQCRVLPRRQPPDLFKRIDCHVYNFPSVSDPLRKGSSFRVKVASVNPLPFPRSRANKQLASSPARAISLPTEIRPSSLPSDIRPELGVSPPVYPHYPPSHQQPQHPLPNPPLLQPHLSTSLDSSASSSLLLSGSPSGSPFRHILSPSRLTGHQGPPVSSSPPPSSSSSSSTSSSSSATTTPTGSSPFTPAFPYTSSEPAQAYSPTSSSILPSSPPTRYTASEPPSFHSPPRISPFNPPHSLPVQPPFPSQEPSLGSQSSSTSMPFRSSTSIPFSSSASLSAELASFESLPKPIPFDQLQPPALPIMAKLAFARPESQQEPQYQKQPHPHLHPHLHQQQQKQVSQNNQRTGDNRQTIDLFERTETVWSPPPASFSFPINPIRFDFSSPRCAFLPATASPSLLTTSPLATFIDQCHNWTTLRFD